jgi:hypothetical protein
MVNSMKVLWLSNGSTMKRIELNCYSSKGNKDAVLAMMVMAMYCTIARMTRQTGTLMILTSSTGLAIRLTIADDGENNEIVMRDNFDVD